MEKKTYLYSYQKREMLHHYKSLRSSNQQGDCHLPIISSLPPADYYYTDQFLDRELWSHILVLSLLYHLLCGLTTWNTAQKRKRNLNKMIFRHSAVSRLLLALTTVAFLHKCNLNLWSKLRSLQFSLQTKHVNPCSIVWPEKKILLINSNKKQ